METLVERSLVKIRKLTSSRTQKELREACDNVLAKIQQKTKMEEPEFFYPLCLAILGRQPKITSQALDCLEKLISYGYMRGNGPVTATIASKIILPTAQGNEKSEDNTAITPDTKGPAANNEPKLMDAVVACICSCNDHHDEEVQLQVLKAVLQAVTSNTCEVHEHSLLKSVRACYHIHLVSKNTMNQTVAKATLQQMVNVVFQRMELYEEKLLEKEEEEQRNASRQNSKENISADQRTNSSTFVIEETPSLKGKPEKKEDGITIKQDDKHPESTYYMNRGIATVSEPTHALYPSMLHDFIF